MLTSCKQEVLLKIFFGNFPIIQRTQFYLALSNNGSTAMQVLNMNIYICNKRKYMYVLNVNIYVLKICKYTKIINHARKLLRKTDIS